MDVPAVPGHSTPLCILREEFQGENDAVKIWLEDRTWSLQIREGMERRKEGMTKGQQGL